MNVNKKSEKKKYWFAEDVKQPSEAEMMCTIDGNTFFLFTKNIWIGDSSPSCHITNDNNGMYDVINIDESIQGSSGIIRYEEGQATSNGTSSEWRRSGPYSMAYEVLSFGRC